MKVLVVGPGRAGCQLALAHRQADDQVVLLGRRSGKWQGWARRNGIATATSLKRVPPDCVRLIIAVADADITAVATVLCGILPPDKQRMTIHLSGMTGLGALSCFAERGEQVAAVHPIYAFAEACSCDSARLGGAAVTVLASDNGRAAAKSLVRKWGAKPLELDADGDRRRYHLALTLASNHLAGAFGRAEEILGDTLGQCGREVLASLAVQSIVSCAQVGAAQALTGPIVRAELSTIKQHLAAISKQEREKLRPLLLALTEFAVDSGRLDKSAARRLRKLLSA
ncbi:MAG: hypothetical protein COB96_01995 [Planctomycetota bacterium]|nr:MAG: hypothetical protein COB96_01995 [Planctomycetota bacterium]